jgi:hypothetical protein
VFPFRQLSLCTAASIVFHTRGCWPEMISRRKLWNCAHQLCIFRWNSEKRRSKLVSISWVIYLSISLPLPSHFFLWVDFILFLLFRREAIQKSRVGIGFLSGLARFADATGRNRQKRSEALSDFVQVSWVWLTGPQFLGYCAAMRHTRPMNWSGFIQNLPTTENLCICFPHHYLNN